MVLIQALAPPLNLPDVGLGLLHPHLPNEVDSPRLVEGVLVGIQPEEGKHLFSPLSSVSPIKLPGGQGGVNLDTTKCLPRE